MRVHIVISLAVNAKSQKAANKKALDIVRRQGFDGPIVVPTSRPVLCCRASMSFPVDDVTRCSDCDKPIQFEQTGYYEAAQ